MTWIRALACRMSVERGQTLAEYAVLVTMIAVVVISVALLLGGNITALFSKSARGV